MTEAHRIQTVYQSHPLSARSILARLANTRFSSDALDELDLAIDPHRGVTDQNNLGGHRTVIAIARLLGVGVSTRVLDVGSGLGGPARLLAYLYGCSVQGVELSPERLADAKELTSAVNLHDLVSFSGGDFLSMRLEERGYDVVLLLDTLVHFQSVHAALTHCVRLLRRDGWIAIANPFLRHAVRGAQLDELNSLWAGHLSLAETAIDFVVGAGCSVVRHDDLSPVAVAFFADRLNKIDRFAEFPASERRAWLLARDLLQENVLSYELVVAQKSR